ncbi:unnamed protein product [Ambrosiozyma monospora]|uniref:Unnamed protein product n=1 Tax=Ambrosiozyma monospora TaxID=43982 RepID=A0A9W6YSN7_AMBMO|nr:unnamed protein product [Ambrosiozyma monospora]
MHYSSSRSSKKPNTNSKAQSKTTTKSKTKSKATISKSKSKSKTKPKSKSPTLKISLRSLAQKKKLSIDTVSTPNLRINDDKAMLSQNESTGNSGIVTPAGSSPTSGDFPAEVDVKVEGSSPGPEDGNAEITGEEVNSFQEPALARIMLITGQAIDEPPSNRIKKEVMGSRKLRQQQLKIQQFNQKKAAEAEAKAKAEAEASDDSSKMNDDSTEERGHNLRNGYGNGKHVKLTMSGGGLGLTTTTNKPPSSGMEFTPEAEEIIEQRAKYISKLRTRDSEAITTFSSERGKLSPTSSTSNDKFEVTLPLTPRKRKLQHDFDDHHNNAKINNDAPAARDYDVKKKLKQSPVKRSKAYGQMPPKNSSSSSTTTNNNSEKSQGGPGEGIIDNEDFCSSCGLPGLFLCCESCPRSFHFHCLNPPIDEHDLPDEWHCNECLSKKTGSNLMNVPMSNPFFNPQPIYKKPNGNNYKSIFGGAGSGNIGGSSSGSGAGVKHGTKRTIQMQPTQVGIFATLFTHLTTTNPVAFRLPLSIVESFQGVSQDKKTGDYVDNSLKPLKTYKQLMTERSDPLNDVYDKLSGDALFCHKCGGSGLDARSTVIGFNSSITGSGISINPNDDIQRVESESEKTKSIKNESDVSKSGSQPMSKSSSMNDPISVRVSRRVSHTPLASSSSSSSSTSTKTNSQTTKNPTTVIDSTIPTASNKLPDRSLIRCDYCDLNWHLDCLPTPMASVKKLGSKWMCPNHVEKLIQPQRKLRNQDIVTVAVTHGVKLDKDANIEIINVEDTTSSRNNHHANSSSRGPGYGGSGDNSMIDDGSEARVIKYLDPIFQVDPTVPNELIYKTTANTTLPASSKNNNPKFTTYKIKEESIILDFLTSSKIKKINETNQQSSTNQSIMMNLNNDLQNYVMSLSQLSQRSIVSQQQQYDQEQKKRINFKQLLNVVDDRYKLEFEELEKSELEELLCLKRLLDIRGIDEVKKFFGV